MESIRKRIHLQRAATVVLFLAFTFAGGCTLSGIDGNVNSSVSDDDLTAASQILGESLSSDNSGLVLSLNDAMTTVSKDGFASGSLQKSVTPTLQNDSGRGSESNYSYSYDSETGVHTVSFLRTINRPLFSKEVTDTLKYIFTDNNGEYIEFPRTEKERIETINYNGRRQGMVETPRKNSSFVRVDTLFIDGVSNASSILQIDGVHNGSGTFELERSNGDFLERNYRLRINFLNIEINKELAKNGLDDGDVKDRDHEFEGQVISVNLDRHFFTLRSGFQIFVNQETEFDNDNYPSLRKIQEAIRSGTKIWAEGEGFRRAQRFIATEVDIERIEEDDETDEDRREFEEFVTSVNPAQNTFTVAETVILKVDSLDTIDDSGDYTSLQEVQSALDQGIQVMADGEAKVLGDNAQADMLVLDVRFEDESDSDSDNEED